MKNLSKFEKCLWFSSAIIILISSLLSPSTDYISIIASLIGVTSLIFLAKGYVIGQVLILIFSLLYGYISFSFSYYGEMITYLFLTSPMAILAIISWTKNPYKKGEKGVKIQDVTIKQILIMIFLTLTATVMSYFILKLFDTANLEFSTLSVLTSFSAAYLTFLRSPLYAIAYGLNDIVLIILWTLATFENPMYFSMIICFVIFLINDIYGFISWSKMRKQQLKI